MIFPFVSAAVLIPTCGVCVEICFDVIVVDELPTHVLAAMPAICCEPGDLPVYVLLVGLSEFFSLILCVVFAVCVP